MTSVPRIESSMSETEEDFTRLVEAHRDGRDRTYQYGNTRASGLDLPGDAVRFCAATIDLDEDVSERRHTVAYLSRALDGRPRAIATLRHTLKEIEAMQGRQMLLQSTFELTGYDIPQGVFPRTTIERVVQDYIDRFEVVPLLPVDDPIRQAGCASCA